MTKLNRIERLLDGSSCGVLFSGQYINHHRESKETTERYIEFIIRCARSHTHITLLKSIVEAY